MNAQDVLKYGHTFVLTHVEKVPPDEWETPNVCGWWSTKEIMAHLASFEHVFTEVIQTFLGSDVGPTMRRIGESEGNFNDLEVEARKSWSPEKVVADYSETHARNLALISQIPVEVRRKPGTMPWYGAEYDLEDFITYSSYGHKREHMAQVGVFLDSLKGKMAT